jgi:outer membrane protein TolC
LEVAAVTKMSQKRALKNYRKRLSARGVARFEVLGLDADRGLIRSLAKRLVENGSDAKRIRAAVRRTISGYPPKKGGILAALRRSPLVGADLNVKRAVVHGRKVDL